MWGKKCRNGKCEKNVENFFSCNIFISDNKFRGKSNIVDSTFIDSLNLMKSACSLFALDITSRLTLLSSSFLFLINVNAEFVSISAFSTIARSSSTFVTLILIFIIMAYIGSQTDNNINAVPIWSSNPTGFRNVCGILTLIR